MNLNQIFNREIFGYIRKNNEEKGLEAITPEIIENMDNDPDMLLITEAGLNPFTGIDITEIETEETEPAAATVSSESDDTERNFLAELPDTEML